MTTQVTPVLRSEPQEQFSAKFEQFMIDFATIVDEINAASSAYALSVNSTSSTSETIGTGSKTFTIGTGLGHVVGMAVRYAFDDTNYMDGVVVSYNASTGEEVVNFSSSNGSGTYAAWSVSLGSTGDFVSKAGGSFTGDVSVPADPYDQASWDGNNEVPTKNDVRDELESVKATIPDGITTATPIATTSGTEHDFTSIPSGVKRITVMMSSVSLNGSAEVIVQVGDSGGFVTSGYDAMVGATLTTSNTTRGVITSDGFYTTTASLASYAMNGSLALVLLDGATNTWSCTGAFYGAGGNLVATVAGTVTLSNPLDRIRITSNGADTFDAGTVNIMYEG